MTVRPATARDVQEIASLFHETVKAINRRDYSAAQIAAWAGEAPDPGKWLERMRTRKTFVAEADGKVVGFAELGADGHIDAFYVHAQRQREGVGTALLARLEAEADALGFAFLFTEASITAAPFFTKHGFNRVRAQDISYRGVEFRNYRMTKNRHRRAAGLGGFGS